MLAVLLTVALFLFLTLLGKAVIEALSFRISILRGWLLAPSIGLAVVVLLSLNINQAGLPIKTFASSLALICSLFIALVFWRKRPALPWKQLAPFLGAAIFALLYSCWPMFRYGFRWFGYMNGDMSLYCLDAARMMNHGFFQTPTLQELNGTDYTQYMWFQSAVSLFRCGADIFLAWIASLIHDQPLRISMSAVGVAEMAQLWSAAALILTRLSYRRLALVTALLVAASPFFILGVMAQLLPQVGGLALLLCFCTLCMRPQPAGRSWGALLPNAVLVALMGAACCIYYPEVLPFGALAIIAYHLVLLIQRKELFSSVLALWIPILIFLVAIARQGLVTAIGTVLFSLSAGIPSGEIAQTDFDRVLDPSILASLPGFEAYYGLHRDPWISIAVCFGAVLLLLAVAIELRYAWKAQPATFLFLVMLGLGIRLFFGHAAFGVFKLAMYIQPVLLFSLAVVAVSALGKKCYLIPAMYLAATMATAILYVKVSAGSLTPYTLPGINNAVVRTLPTARGEELVLSSLNEVGGAIYAAQSAGTNVKLADYDYFVGLAAPGLIPSLLLQIPTWFGLTRDRLTPAAAMHDTLLSTIPAPEIILGHPLPGRSRAVEGPLVSYLGHVDRDFWVSSNNAHTAEKHSDNYFTFDRIDSVENYAVLLTTQLGGPIGLGGTKVARWPPETDIYNPSGTFYGVGRNLLFEVLHPIPNSRLRISLSRTLTGGGRTVLPKNAEVDAATNQKLGLIGSGASNITTPPLQFYQRNGRSYFALDFGTEGSYFENHKTGLLRMFNANIPIDNRKFIGFVRDLALVTDAQYRAMERPTSISSFPAGLVSHPSLEFSGIYEDGWISNRAFVILGRAKAGDQLHVTGQLPSLPRFVASGNAIRVLLNGKVIHQSHIRPGFFEITNTLTADSTENRLDFFFDNMDPLPRNDDRPVAAQLFQITITSASAGTKGYDPASLHRKIPMMHPVFLHRRGE